MVLGRGSEPHVMLRQRRPVSTLALLLGMLVSLPVKCLVLVMLVACGDNLAMPPDAAIDAALRVWSCSLERDCAGSDVTTASVVTAATEQAAEMTLINECHSPPCAGALDCHAVCMIP